MTLRTLFIFFKTKFSLHMNSKRIGIVYFAYINYNKNWKKLIYSQLSDIKRSGVLKDASLYIEVSDTKDSSEVKDFFNNLDIPCQDVCFHNENAFEYFGIHKVWELAVNKAHDYLIYLHTKGMSYKNRLSLCLKSGRNPREIVLTYLTFKDYKNTLKVFDTNSNIMKIGAFPKKDYDPNDKRGCFIWFNFFWVRASYVTELNEPIKTNDRFYYEDWLTKNEGEKGDAYKELTYSLYTHNHTGFSVTEASDIVKMLNKLYKYLWPLSALYIKYMYKKANK